MCVEDEGKYSVLDIVFGGVKWRIVNIRWWMYGAIYRGNTIFFRTGQSEDHEILVSKLETIKNIKR